MNSSTGEGCRLRSNEVLRVFVGTNSHEMMFWVMDIKFMGLFVNQVCE